MIKIKVTNLWNGTYTKFNSMVKASLFIEQKKRYIGYKISRKIYNNFDFKWEVTK